MSYQFEPAEVERREELFGDRRDDEEPPPRRLLRVAATLAVMALFAAGLWFAYVAGGRRAGGAGAGEVPLIHADARPMMVKPAAPGGLRIPDRNMLIYEPNQRLVEHLLPPPEQPLPRPTPAAAPALPPPGGAASAAVPNSTAPAAPVPAPAAAAAEGSAGRAVAAPTTTAAMAKRPPSSPGMPAAPGGNVRLQLASVRSADGARQEWARIRQKNSDLLGALSASPVRADLGDKGVYYRIETGPVGDLAAERICGVLKQRRFGCIIVR
jgi:sporulation related protein